MSKVELAPEDLGDLDDMMDGFVSKATRAGTSLPVFAPAIHMQVECTDGRLVDIYMTSERDTAERLNAAFKEPE